MTRSDRWKKRPCVLRYWAFADAIRACAPELPSKPECLTVEVFMPIPKSYSVKKKASLKGMPHQERGDGDNLAKAVADSLFKEDKTIWHWVVKKFWDDGEGPRIEVIVVRYERRP